MPALAAKDLSDDEPVLQAREALRRGDSQRLLGLRDRLVEASHPLAPWADYWDLSSRLPRATVDEVERFYARWRGSYVEDRLRNDWLLELGRRRDWAAFSRDLPRFRMNDDSEVLCYALLADVQSGRDVTQAALAAWREQRLADDGCHELATALRDAERIGERELWQRLHETAALGRQGPARQAAQLLGAPVARALDPLWRNPARFLARIGSVARALQQPLGVLAVTRLAVDDPAAAAQRLDAPWARELGPDWAAAAWGAVARQASVQQLPEATEWGDVALQLSVRAAAGFGLDDGTLGWIARAHLRAAGADAPAWNRVLAAIDAMSEDARDEPRWTYWRARALLARGRPGMTDEQALASARALLERIASPLEFYGQLALEQLGRSLALPGRAAAPSPLERERAADQPGLQRALRLIGIGLRSEGVREWNFSLIGMDDRQLLAAAQLACDRQVWDRCIHSSERTRHEVDPALRYPLAFADEVMAAAARSGLDPALVFGLIRQESRFVAIARSSAGAAGLMQVMPATARWTARRIGLALGRDWRDDHAINLRLGTSYLRMVLDDFGSSLPMSLAAYNAGPSRPRRWREGPVLEPAIWAETIPIRETRDYVKKVLANAAVYTRLLGKQPPSTLKSLLGQAIGPREPDAPQPNKELP